MKHVNQTEIGPNGCVRVGYSPTLVGGMEWWFAHIDLDNPPFMN